MINAEILNKSGIDYSTGMERFMHDEELYEEVLSVFVKEKLYERSEAAFAADDRALLLRTVHETKGASGNAGLKNLYEQSSALVKLLRSDSYTDGELEEAYTRFINVYRLTRDAVIAALS